ncbi:MarR family winged helix-turn-helix transcriptional regulator [Actinomycetospora sp. C-140]
MATAELGAGGGTPDDPSDDPPDDTGSGGADDVDRVERDWRRERPDVDVGSIGVVSRVWRIGRHLEHRRKAQLDRFGTDRGSIDMLAMLRRAGPPFRRTAGELTRSALITSGGVSQRLDKLEKAGLVTRHVDTADRRRVDVELTPAGVDLVDTVLVGLMDSESRVLDEALTASEQDRLRELLRKLLLTLEPPDAGR